MAEPTPTRRRWFQFSLTTMFVVVTVFAVWLRWELAFIQERKAAIASARVLSENELIDEEPTDTNVVFVRFPGDGPDLGDEPSLPFWRIWLGDQPVASVATNPDASDETTQKWKRLFPEAEIDSCERTV